MIKIIENEKYIEISGHANYGEAGEDIVCASVSSIMYTTVNGILNIDETAIEFIDSGDVVRIDILKNDDVVLKLISNMIELLKELQRQYPTRIKFSKGD